MIILLPVVFLVVSVVVTVGRVSLPLAVWAPVPLKTVTETLKTDKDDELSRDNKSCQRHQKGRALSD